MTTLIEMVGLTALGIILAHLVGDYILQSHWMATEKTQHWWPALVHGFFYTLPYIFVTQSIWALLFIGLTHAIIDRYRLAKHVGWLKNKIGPRRSRPSFSEAMENGGYNSATPVFMSTFLMIVTDNTLHLVLNTIAVIWF